MTFFSKKKSPINLRTISSVSSFSWNHFIHQKIEKVLSAIGEGNSFRKKRLSPDDCWQMALLSMADCIRISCKRKKGGKYEIFRLRMLSASVSMETAAQWPTAVINYFFFSFIPFTFRVEKFTHASLFLPFSISFRPDRSAMAATASNLPHGPMNFLNATIPAEMDSFSSYFPLISIWLK